MKKWIASWAAAFVLSVAVISSAEACYSAADFEAEQGVRIHSELMVIGLTCLKMPEGRELYRKYQDFTLKNSSLIAGYETDIINHYASEGVAEPEQKFHTLRTDLANEVARQAVAMSMLSFCRQFSPRIDAALSMDEPKLRRWAQHVWPGQPPSEPVCDSVSLNTQ
ncbi:MAG: hypothetical protein K8R48_08860 [Alphaproteobacteria bacterium]|nr:hypothetical protein [Alphaproteobacteria bacterium]